MGRDNGVVSRHVDVKDSKGNPYWHAYGRPVILEVAAPVPKPDPAPTLPPEPVATEDAFAYVTGNVNIRTGPGIEYSSLGVARAGTKLHVLPAVNGWRRVSVKVDGDLTLAYISDKYIKRRLSLDDKEGWYKRWNISGPG